VLHERPDNDVAGVAYRHHFLVPDARRLDARHVYAFPVCIRVRETSPRCDRLIFHCRVTQNVSRGKANILKDNSVNRCKCTRILMNTYLNLDSYRVCDCNSHEITINLKILIFSAYSKVLIVKSYYQSRYLCILKYKLLWVASGQLRAFRLTRNDRRCHLSNVDHFYGTSCTS